MLQLDIREAIQQPRSASKLINMPTFLLIGAGKSGTTSIYNYLRQHPDVYMPRIKEPLFFAFEGQRVNFCGPGDAEIFPMFKAASLGLCAYPGARQSRVSLIHGADLAVRGARLLRAPEAKRAAAAWI